MLSLLLLALTVPTSAAVYQVVTGASEFQKAPEYQAVLGQLKLHGGFAARPAEIPAPGPAPMTRGQQAVEAAKARNREALAKKRAHESAQAKASAELSTLEQWKAEVKQTHAQWRQEIEDQRLQWKKEQDIFLGRVKEYKAATYVIPAPAEKIVEKKIPVESLPEAHVVSAAFDVPIRDQGARATCAAFAGIRAVEIVLAQNKVSEDLSEQYLYWASKPTCRQSPCKEKGSWVTRGYDYSKEQDRIDIPTEKTCAYTPQINASNETYVPLTETCREGVVQILDYARARTLSDVVESVKKNIPVVISAKLTTNFYLNEGLITFQEAQKNAGQKQDQHTQGHAFLIVGVMELPEKLRGQEGNFCLLAANSWGKGWGAGGYACITEKWLTSYRSDNTFVGPTKVAHR